MNRMTRGLIVAALHLAIVGSIGGKLLYDRATRPRVWVQVQGYDPMLPIRGRYVRLRLINPPVPQNEPVLYFLPQNKPDPTRRPAGEQLWAELTVPKKGPLRPIRLGVKRDGGTIQPIE
jgi:hypothetical protein